MPRQLFLLFVAPIAAVVFLSLGSRTGAVSLNVLPMRPVAPPLVFPSQSLAVGSLAWPSLSPSREAAVHVAAGFVPRAAIDQLRDTLAGIAFDEDADSVDGMSTFEFYLQHNASGTRLPATKPDTPARITARKALRDITDPVIHSRITPLVNALYPAACRGGCTPCFSLVRQWVILLLLY
jgi:hypothetical protein